MNLINYNVELNNINLTPFKYIMCALIHKFSFKSNYPIDASFPPFDTFHPLLRGSFLLYFQASSCTYSFGSVV